MLSSRTHPLPQGRLRAALPGYVLWPLAERCLHGRAPPLVPPPVHHPLCGRILTHAIQASLQLYSYDIPKANSPASRPARYWSQVHSTYQVRDTKPGDQVPRTKKVGRGGSRRAQFHHYHNNEGGLRKRYMLLTYYFRETCTWGLYRVCCKLYQQRSFTVTLPSASQGNIHWYYPDEIPG